VEKLFEKEELSIRGPSVVAGVRGTDFGCDIIAEPGETEQNKELIARVYCFDGEVEVKKLEKVEKERWEKPEKEPEQKVTETVVIGSNQMAFLSIEEPAQPIRKTEIEESISEYWKTNEFKGKVVEPEQLPALSVSSTKEEEEQVTSKTEEQPAQEKTAAPEAGPTDTTGEAEGKPSRGEEGEPKPEKQTPKPPKLTIPQQMRISGTVFTVLGGLIETAGILSYFIGSDVFPDLAPSGAQDIGTAGMLVGGFTLGSGLILLIGSFLGE
jgi:hypothetical protein